MSMFYWSMSMLVYGRYIDIDVDQCRCGQTSTSRQAYTYFDIRGFNFLSSRVFYHLTLRALSGHS